MDIKHNIDWIKDRLNYKKLKQKYYQKILIIIEN